MSDSAATRRTSAITFPEGSVFQLSPKTAVSTFNCPEIITAVMTGSRASLLPMSGHIRRELFPSGMLTERSVSERQSVPAHSGIHRHTYRDITDTYGFRTAYLQVR